MIRAGCLIDPGVRTDHTNDDRAALCGNVVAEGYLYAESREKLVAAVFDGVGGELFGYEASGTGASMLASAFDRGDERLYTAAGMSDIIIGINGAIKERQHTDRDHRGMASTVAGVSVDRESFILFNVGDSKVYRYRRGYVRQLSKDDSGGGHVITKWLGMDGLVPSAEEYPGRVLAGDIFVICSDGISDAVNENDLERELDILSEAGDIEASCRRLNALAISNGSEDNCTIILVKVD